MKASEKEIILNALNKVKDGDVYKTLGICANLRFHLYKGELNHVYALFTSFLFEIVPKWKHFSGDLTFPVPHPTLDSITAYLEPKKWTGKYGKMRLDLLDFLIEKLRAVRPSEASECVRCSQRKSEKETLTR